MKHFSLLLIFVLISALLVCCTSSDETEKELEYDEAAEAGLNGYTCLIHQNVSVHSNIDRNNAMLSPFGFAAETVQVDEAVKRISDIEEELGCDIVLQSISTGSSVLAYDQLAGSYQAEAIYADNQGTSTDLMNMSALFPLDDVSTMDLSDSKYGGPNILECHARNGIVYGVCPVKWLFKQPITIGVFVFNNDLCNRFALDNPSELLETNSWTWDALENILVSHTIDDGNHQYTALACRFFDFIKLSVFGNGCIPAYYDSLGEIATDITSDKAMEAYDWCKKLATDYGYCFTYGTQNVDWGETTAALINEQSMISLTANWVVYDNFVWKLNNLTMMPFPSGPSTEYGNWSSVMETTDCMAIYLQARDPEACGMVISRLYEGMESTPDEDALCKYLSDHVVNTMQDARILLNLYKYGKYTYWYGTDADSYWRNFVDGQIVKKSIAQLIQSKEGVLKNILNKYVAPNSVIYDKYGSGQ